MIIEIPDMIFAFLNEQDQERTAERLVYNSSDILKILVHQDTNRALPKGYNAEVKLAMSHILISLIVLSLQTRFNMKEIVKLAVDGIQDHSGEW